MKQILKKILIVILIFLTINTFILSNVSYAGVLETIGEGIVGLLAWPVQLLLKWVGTAISAVTAGVAYLDGAGDDADTKTLTPFDILYNTTEKPDVKLININVFDISEPESITGKIRTGIAAWYYVLRIIAVAILLVILIYVGIRMAITTIASDKAMYNKMLIDWITSLALIFLLHYIILFTFYVNDALVDAMAGVAAGANIDTAIEQLREEATAFGYKGIGAAAVYFILVTQTIGLLISYINRMLKVSFLVIIAPLITLTYSIDKMGDGKAQALGTWLKEFVFTVLMQPFHCIIYMVMVSTSLELLTSNLGLGGSTERLGYSIFAVICIRFIQEAEKIVRKIFHFEDDNSGTSVAAGMAMSAMMLSQSKNIGRTLKSGVTTAKNLKSGFTNGLTHAKTDAMVMGAILSGHNKTAVTKTETVTETDKDGNEVQKTVETKVGERKMTYAELKEDALARQVEKKADRLARKVADGGQDAAEKYTSKNSRSSLSEQDQARYDTLRNSGMGHTRAMNTLRKEALDKTKKEEFAQKHPNLHSIGNTRRGVVSTYRSLSQLDVVKDFKTLGKTYLSATVGAGVGIAMYGNGRDLMQSGMMGAAAFGSTQEFMKDTTKNLINTASQNVAALRAGSPEEARNIATDALQSDPTRFEENSDEIKQVLENLKNQLRTLGMNEKSVNKFSNKIHKEVRKNAMTGNPESLESIMKRNLSQYNSTPEAQGHQIHFADGDDPGKNTLLLQEAIGQASDFENKKAIFDNFQQATQATGISADAYLDEIVANYKSTSGSLFGEVGSDNRSREEILAEVKSTNDEVDVEDAAKKAKEHAAKAIEGTLSKIAEDAIDNAQISKIKADMVSELEGKIQSEVQDAIKEMQTKSDTQLENTTKELLEQLQELEIERKKLEQQSQEIEKGTRTMDGTQRIEFEKTRIRNEYQIQITSQKVNYAMNYNPIRDPNPKPKQ